MTFDVLAQVIREERLRARCQPNCVPAPGEVGLDKRAVCPSCNRRIGVTVSGRYARRGQLVRLRCALSRARNCNVHGSPLFCGTHCCAWKAGHHAGRVFAARERARDAT